jgi:hypothetical protein
MLLSGPPREFAKTDASFPIASPRRLNMKLDPAAFHADPELLNGLEPKSASIVCQDYRVLFNQGDNPDGLYILKSGCATLTMNSPQGKQLFSLQPDPWLRPRPSRPHRQRALYPHSRRPPRLRPRLHLPRPVPRPHVQRPTPLLQGPPGPRRRSSLRPQRPPRPLVRLSQAPGPSPLVPQSLVP